jgi:methyltransferase
VIASAAVAALVFVPMLVETAISARNERGLRALGATEPERDVYQAMAPAYPGAFVAMLVEGAMRGASASASAGAGADSWFVAGLVIFLLAKALKYWAIASLGPRWTFRVLVPPGSTRTVRGPYRWLAHPNYVGVAGELIGVALAMHAVVTGPLSLLGFGSLMMQRIRIENSALRQGER